MITLNEAIKRTYQNAEHGELITKQVINDSIYQLKFRLEDDMYIWIQYDTVMSHAEFVRFYNGDLGDCIDGMTTFHRLSVSDINKLHNLYSNLFLEL